MTKRKDDAEKTQELDSFAQAQHAAFLEQLGQPQTDEDKARNAAGNLAAGGLQTTGELEVIKAADVAATEKKESDR